MEGIRRKEESCEFVSLKVFCLEANNFYFNLFIIVNYNTLLNLIVRVLNLIIYKGEKCKFNQSANLLQ